MHPILFTIGTLTIHSYDVFYALGGLIGGIIGWRLASAAGVPERRMVLYMLILVPAAIAAGLLNGILFNPGFYISLQQGHLLLEGGIVTYGSILAAGAVTAIFARIYKTNMGRDMDMLARVFAVMLVSFRIGCLLNGCCYGRVTDGFGGVMLPNIYQEWELRYPTQALMVVLDLALAVGLWLYSRRSPAAGALAVSFLIWFGLGRLLIDALREQASVLGPFSLHMIADLLFLLAGVGLVIVRWRRQAASKEQGVA